MNHICVLIIKNTVALSAFQNLLLISLTPFNILTLMDRIRDIEVDIENIKTLEDRIDLENEIEELSTSYTT